MDEIRICNICEEAKKTNSNLKLSDFRKNTGKKPDGTPYYRGICKPCENKKLSDKRRKVLEFSNNSKDKAVIKATKKLQTIKIAWNGVQRDLRKAERELGTLKKGLELQKCPIIQNSIIPPPPPDILPPPPPPPPSTEEVEEVKEVKEVEESKDSCLSKNYKMFLNSDNFEAAFTGAMLENALYKKHKEEIIANIPNGKIQRERFMQQLKMGFTTKQIVSGNLN